ncbi:MAG: hypothetical protein ACD_46C00522G0005 [uncultured bacterium]|nr:MAG: hypothetical protein ACD_46C00522G0005 [uncultured bacterium]
MSKKADITFAQGKFILMGELDMSNVMSVYQKSMGYLSQCEEMSFDFSQLKSSDSSGLALMIEWLKLAKLKQKKITFTNLSAELLSIARAARLDKIINSCQ